MVDFDRNEIKRECWVSKEFMVHHKDIVEKNKKYKEGLLKLNHLLGDEIKIKAIVDKVFNLYEDGTISFIDHALEKGIREYIKEIKEIFEDIYVLGCDKI